MLFRGMLVALPGDRGVGKLESAQEDRLLVSVFNSVTRTVSVLIPTADLVRAYLSPQTRVYVREGHRFRIGRVANYLISDNGLVDYQIRFPNGRRADISEVHLFVRPWSAPDDPADVIAGGGAESQFLHDRRQSAMAPLLRLRAASQGMTALSSAGIDFVAHQIAAVRRVLTDPVQRYLLADEVGLGKTIEAGLVIRQHLIDDPSKGVLVAVPAHLREQWRQELSGKLRLDQFEGAVEVVAHADLARVRRVPDVLIVDEAHHLVGITVGDLADAAARLRALAPDCPVLLLLSATPALGDEVRFLSLLNLLDPGAHPMGDVDGFRRKLEQRREIGRLLLSLDPESPKLVLRQRCAQVQSLFPGDAVAEELAGRLVEATRKTPEELPTLCAELKVYIADSYRIHQRLIRSRRADAQGWEFVARGPSGKDRALSHVVIEAEDSPWIEALASAVEDWRFAAHDAAIGDEGRLNVAARRYAGLLDAVASGRRTLAAWLAIGRDPLFQDEPELLSSMATIVSKDQEGTSGPDLACESARRLLRSLASERATPKIVAFASSPESAAEYYRCLRSVLQDADLMLLCPGDAEAAAAAVRNFAAARRSAVLICDASGEEGLNLACADALVHLDLPFSAARIEQRIGRLDRFGRRNGVVRHRIVLPVDDEMSPWAGWFEFLAHGLGIFERSVSDVQFLVEKFERRAFLALLEGAPGSVGRLCEEIQGAIQEERRSQDEQYALDRIALTEQPVENFLIALEEAEEDEAELEARVDDWLVGALLMQKQSGRDPFSLAATRETLVPRVPWLVGFGLDHRNALTWRRRVASTHSNAALLRPGNPLVDMIERFTRWDDRGTAFMTWRTVPGWEGGAWLGFRLCFVVEPEVEVEDLLTPTVAELALQRRAQCYFAPRGHTLYLDASGVQVTDPELLAILERPYRKARVDNGPVPDVNLSSSPQLLADVIEPSAIGQVARSVRDLARAGLLAQPDLSAAVKTGLRQLEADIHRRRSRLLRERSGNVEVLATELAVLERLVPAIATPRARLDAMGLFVVDGVPPRTVSDG